MSRKITVILGHPDSSSFCGALAERYAAAARAAGHEVRLLKLGDMDFDPILRHGYQRVQPLEPDLQEVSDAILWARHLVFVYPIWWGSIPALLKGMLDRVLLPGYAFRMRKDSPWWDKLLAGRSADLIVTMDTPPWYYRLIYSMPGHHQMKKTILEYCGVKPVRITALGPVRYAPEQRRGRWLQRIERLAAG
ncbi:NAD(P)H-dependent oxidoreductase [Paracidovorax anthurii]|uniref:Putative NADPH-quinone reductase n=1 Tax=Paracidovorax anthurii TaxID=78229 RepID=A0A328ZFE0_9BURK|nr:NAD(P)H-dependent oxidoreductase [Paracidovorax anthurii]RAR84771.1 putative NADPH-quinone reductase [Paracidovorax anthurii]